MRIKYDQLQTKTCGAEENGDHEPKPFTNLRIIADGYYLFPSDVHLLSRERNTTRRAVPITADSESDVLTESSQWGHCEYVLQHHKPKKIVSSERDIVILKQIHAGKNWHVFCFQSVNADPSHRSQQPDSTGTFSASKV